MTKLAVDVPASLEGVLEEERARSGRSTSSIIVAALARYLEKPIHTVFQVSTSGALVAGVYDREVSVETIRRHGDFGLGTPPRRPRLSDSGLRARSRGGSRRGSSVRCRHLVQTGNGRPDRTGGQFQGSRSEL